MEFLGDEELAESVASFCNSCTRVTPELLPPTKDVPFLRVWFGDIARCAGWLELESGLVRRYSSRILRGLPLFWGYSSGDGCGVHRGRPIFARRCHIHGDPWGTLAFRL